MQLAIRKAIQSLLTPFGVRADAGVPMRSPGVDSPYKGASTFRRAGALWGSTSGSANADFLPWQDTLRARSRHLVRNNPLAAGALQTLTDNAIGPGLRVHPEIDREVLGLTDDVADRLERDMVRIWQEWAESCECDLNRMQNFYDLQRLAFHSHLESGDILCLAPGVNRPGADLQTRVQLVEADRIVNPNFQLDTQFLSGGVELDNNAAPTAYHVRSSHPGDLFSFAQPNPFQTQRIRAFGIASGRKNAWLLFDRTRPQQTRGVPYMAVVLEQLKQSERYTDAELHAAIVGGAFTVFVKSQNGQGLLPLATQSGQPSSERERSNADDIFLDYGAIVDLAQGEEIQLADPKRPNRAFGEFIRSVVEQMGAGIGIPFELMVKHFTASYSASRGALLEFKKFYMPKRFWFANSFCFPFYELVLTEAVIRGRLNAPGFLDDPSIRRAYLHCSWRGPSQGQLNPLDEVLAAEKRIALEISTTEQETAEMNGGDWEANHVQRMKEVNKQRTDGTAPADVSSPTPAPAPAGAAAASNRDALVKAEQAVSEAVAEANEVMIEAMDRARSDYLRAMVTQSQQPPAQVHVNVQPPDVKVEVNPPQVKVESPQVHIKQPDVHVNVQPSPPAQVHFPAPEPKHKKVSRKVERDKDGNISRIVEE